MKTLAYAYDSFGYLSTITTNGGQRGLVVDPLTNRISGSGYDAAGSMTSWGSGGMTYSYVYYPYGEEIAASSQAMAAGLTPRRDRPRRRPEKQSGRGCPRPSGICD